MTIAHLCLMASAQSAHGRSKDVERNYHRFASDTEAPSAFLHHVRSCIPCVREGVKTLDLGSTGAGWSEALDLKKFVGRTRVKKSRRSRGSARVRHFLVCPQLWIAVPSDE